MTIIQFLQVFLYGVKQILCSRCDSLAMETFVRGPCYTRVSTGFLYLETCVLEALTTSACRNLVHSAAENVSSLAWQTNDSCYDLFKILGDHLIIRFVSGFSDEL